MTVYFHSEAEGELRDAIAWYEHQRNGLGLEFAFCIDKAKLAFGEAQKHIPKFTEKYGDSSSVDFPLRFFMRLRKAKFVFSLYFTRAGIQNSGKLGNDHLSTRESVNK